MSTRVSDNQRIFHAAAWMWLAYQVCLAILDGFIYARLPNLIILRYHLLGGSLSIAFLAAAYAKGWKNQIRIAAPIMILWITMAPILLTYLFRLQLPPGPLANLEGLALRQLPMFMLGMVLVAWHYNLGTIIFYALIANLGEFAIVFSFQLLSGVRLSAYWFIMLIRVVCLIVTGVFINQLITRLRIQQESLQSANTQLAHYASTLESLTVSRERNRMSRELHDTVVHTLSGLSVQLETTRAYLGVNPETAGTLLDKSLEATRTGLQETRRALKALRASPLEDLGLVQAIRALVDNAAQRGRMSDQVQLPETDPVLSPDVELCLYRVTQEAIENVIHHANAQNLGVNLAVDEDHIELVIQDDGCGFDPENQLVPGHYGIPGMQERAALVGGELTITSSCDGGTIIHLVIRGYNR